jgi:hypothetical protein
VRDYTYSTGWWCVWFVLCSASAQTAAGVDLQVISSQLTGHIVCCLGPMTRGEGGGLLQYRAGHAIVVGFTDELL